MQVTIEEVNSVKKILHIEVPEETVVSELDNAYNQLKKTAKVNGFRPGKTPRSVLERQFKKDVHSDVVNTLIQNSLVEVIREKDISFIGEPMIEPPELDPKSVYKYSATIETKPVLGAIDFSGLTLEKTQYKISDEEVNTQLEMMRKNLASRVDIKDQRPVEENDFLMMDHVGQVNGESFEATPEVVNGPYKVGSALFSRDFDDQLIGLNPGDSKTFEIDYDDSYINSGLAGNKVSFTVKVNAIQEEVLPELDDELAKRIGAYETLDSLKAEIVNNLEQGYQKRVEHEVNEQAYSALIERVSFDVPDIMVNYELAGIIAEAERAFAMNGITLEQIGKTREDLAEEYRDLAEKQVRRHLILDAVIEQEKLELSDDELEAGYEETAKNINQPVDGIKAFYTQQPDKLDYFKHTLLEKKAITLIIDNSEVKEVQPEAESE